MHQVLKKSLQEIQIAIFHQRKIHSFPLQIENHKNQL